MVSPSFATVLREASVQDHSAAEGNDYIRALLEGRLPLAAFAAFTAQLHAVYTVLEEAVEAHRAHPVTGRFCFPELTRKPALEADLEEMLGADWADQVSTVPATAAYVERLREVAFDRPGEFVAHHYVRYMGDLSGGLVIGRIVEKTYGMGASFYRFPTIAKPKAFKDAYRALLDETPWDDAERAAIVAEVKLGYRLNSDIFHDLAREPVA